jgi:hypothetical protein
MVALRLILLALGLGFFAYLVATTGPETLLASVQSLSWWLLLVVAFPAALVVTLTLVRRARELTRVVAGLVALSFFRAAPPAPKSA